MKYIRTLAELIKKYITHEVSEAPKKGCIEIPYDRAKDYLNSEPLLFLFEDKDTKYRVIQNMNLIDSPMGKYATVYRGQEDIPWEMLDLCTPRTFITTLDGMEVLDRVEFYRIAHDHNNATNIDITCNVVELDVRADVKYNRMIIKHISGDGVTKAYDLVIMYSALYIQAWRVQNDIVVEEYAYTDDINDILRAEGVNPKFHATKFEIPGFGHLTVSGLQVLMINRASRYRLIVNDEGNTHQAEYYTLGRTTDEECIVVYDNYAVGQAFEDDEDEDEDVETIINKITDDEDTFL